MYFPPYMSARDKKRCKVDKIKQILEAAIFAADAPVTRDTLVGLFEIGEVDKAAVSQHLQSLQEDYADSGLELKEVASGFRFQVRTSFGPWVSRLWQEKPPRYTRATLETLALIAYRQPITRGEIEDVRGVAVSSQIVKNLLERNWVRIVGHRDVPGRPALYATTKQFLDYFDLKSLDQLPTLAEIRDLDDINRELELEQGPDEETVEKAARPDESWEAREGEVKEIESVNEAEEKETLAKVDAVLNDFDARFRRQPTTDEQPVTEQTDQAALTTPSTTPELSDE